MGNFRFARQIFGAMALLALSQGTNGQPLVNAGDDQLGVTLSTARSGSIRLMGEADPYDSLRWVQVSGPQAVINEPGSSISLVTLPDTGAYVFELRVYVQGATYTDSVTVTVRPDQPFIVLAPSNDAPVPRGQPYTVTWQMDPSIPCMVWYSVDSGATLVLINEGGGATDSIVWDVPADLVPGTHGTIVVKDYVTRDLSAEGTFVVASTAVEIHIVKKQQPGMVVRRDGRGVLHVACAGGYSPGSLAVFDLGGAFMLSALAGAPAAASPSSAGVPRILLYRAADGNGAVHRGRVQDSR